MPAMPIATIWIRALVFDFDGVIVDTESSDLRAWRDVFEDHGAELTLAVWAQVIGTQEHHFDPIEHLELLLRMPVDRARVAADFARRRLELTVVQPLLPGVRELVSYARAQGIKARAQGIKLAVASSSSRDWVEGLLESRGILSDFDCVCCREDVARTKPYPDLYIAALSCLGISALETVALEDSPNGIAAARAAGTYVVALPNPVTAELDLSGADTHLESLAAVPPAELLGQLRR
jgi:HAD superfamily hydrolase (TIGR01509 family)